MSEGDYAHLQERYGERYIAQLGAEVVATGATYDELCEELEARGLEWSSLIIEYVEAPTSIGVYGVPARLEAHAVRSGERPELGPSTSRAWPSIRRGASTYRGSRPHQAHACPAR